MISVGVDIGAFSIKIAEVEATSKSYAIRRLQEFPLSLDLTKDKKIEIIDTLRTLFSQYDLDQTQFIFAVPQRAVSVHYLRLPFRERFKVQKAIIAQLEDELPFSQEDAIFEAKIVQYAGKAADILAMAAPVERVSDVNDLAHDCGVEPLLISADGVGLNNLFERWWDAPPEGLAGEQDIPVAKNAELIVNIGHLATEVLVYAEGILVAIRNIDWGAKNIADAIGRKYGLNYLQAMAELQSKGFVLLDKSQGTREQAAFSETIESALEFVIGDMRLKMLELQSQLNLKWNKGYLLGGGAQLKNLGAYLTQHFEIPFNRYKQFEKHPAVAFESNPHLELVSGVAVGLALEGLRRPRNPGTNFLKGDLASSANMLEVVWQKWGYTAQVAGSAFVIFLIFAFLREGLSLRLLEQSDQALRTQAQAVAGLRGGQATPSKIRNYIVGQERMEKNRKEAERVHQLNSALDVLNLISGSFPKGATLPLEIKRVSINNGTAEVHGYTNSTQLRDQILSALGKVASGKVQTTPVRINTPAGKVGFAYRFDVKRFGG